MKGSLKISSLDRLLSPDATILHRTRRLWFEKRIVGVAEQKYVLYRFPVPRRAQKLAALLHDAEKLGIPMQRCELVRARWSDLLRYGGCWLVASHESGDVMKPQGLNGDIVASLATSLGRLHSIKARRHGPLFQYGRFFRSLADEVGADIGLALECADLHEPAEKERLSRWLQARDGFLRQQKTFHLVHGDLLTKNILVREGGAEVCLIDYELAAFDHAGFELAEALIRFFGGRNRIFRLAFLERYLSVCNEGIAKDWNDHSHYFLVSAALRLARSRIRRRRMLLRRGKEEEAAVHTGRFNGYVGTAFSLMHAYNSGVKCPDEMLAAGAARKPAAASRSPLERV